MFLSYSFPCSSCSCPFRYCSCSSFPCYCFFFWSLLLFFFLFLAHVLHLIFLHLLHSLLHVLALQFSIFTYFLFFLLLYLFCSSCFVVAFVVVLLVHHYHLHHHHHLLLVSFLDSFLFPAQAYHWNLWTRLVITSYPSDRDLSTVLIYATFKIYWWPQGLGSSSKEFESQEPAGKEIFLIRLFFKEIRKASEVHQTHLSLHSFHLFYKHIHQRDLHVSLQWSITWNHSLQFYYLRVRHIQRFGIAKRNHYVKSLGLCKVAQTVDALLPNLPWDLKLLTSCMLILNVLGGNRCKKSCPSCFCRKTKIDGRTLPRLTRS